MTTPDAEPLQPDDTHADTSAKQTAADEILSDEIIESLSLGIEDIEFARYFSLEEAASLLPKIQTDLAEAKAQLANIKDEIVLYKRILTSQKVSGKEPDKEQVKLIKQKYKQYEKTYENWIAQFAEQGIILRDIETGLLDFPYQSKTTEQTFFLCWKSGEEGLFYFHPLSGGYATRQPITLLPD